jgi:hypothetical protein
MPEFLATIPLRNKRTVYRDGRDFVVEQEDSNGHKHSRSIPAFVVDFLHAELKGRRAIVEDAQELLAPKAPSFNLPYDHGHQLRYYAQEVLVVLAALGKAKITKDGRRFLYDVQAV